MKLKIILPLSVFWMGLACGIPATITPTLPPTTVAPSPLPTQSPTPLSSASAPPATSAATPTLTTTPTETATATPGVVEVVYKDFEIVPAQLTISVGTTVTFKIEGGLFSFHQPYNF